jgi:hypothetical protein
MNNKPDWLIQMEQAATKALAEVLAEMENEGEGEDEYITSNNK